jgi:prefoldin subunit 5
MTRIASLALALVPLTSWAADDHRVRFLEQEVRNLQRQVQALTRQVEMLTTRPARLEGRSSPVSDAASAPDSDVWLDAGKWQALKPGMSELEVIEALGPPTSMREEDGSRVLFYAMEIGASGFLSGSVTLRDRVVASVHTPQLQ